MRYNFMLKTNKKIYIERKTYKTNKDIKNKNYRLQNPDKS